MGLSFEKSSRRGKHGNHRRGPRVPGVIVSCEVCGAERRYTPSEMRVRGRIRFCSITCRNTGAVKNLTVVKCAQCGRDCRKRIDRLRTQKNAYCSTLCRDLARSVDGARWRDKAAIRAYMRAYSEQHRDRLNALSRVWARANRGKRVAASQRWRARVKGATIGPIDFDRIAARDRMKCHLCGRRVKRSELHFDHVIPLSRGGEHSERNIAVAHARCNVRKGATLVKLF